MTGAFFVLATRTGLLPTALVTDNATVAAWIVGLTVLLVGFVLEDVGTVIEAHLIDPRLQRASRTHKADWEAYLKLQIRDEIVAQRYIRSKLMQLRFELSMTQAVLAALLILAITQYRSPFLSTSSFVGLSLIAGSLALIGWGFANMTAKLLSQTRRWLLEAIAAGPKGVAGPSKE